LGKETRKKPITGQGPLLEKCEEKKSGEGRSKKKKGGVMQKKKLWEGGRTGTLGGSPVGGGVGGGILRTDA